MARLVSLFLFPLVIASASSQPGISSNNLVHDQPFLGGHGSVPAEPFLKDNDGRAYQLFEPYSPDNATLLQKKTAVALVGQISLGKDSLFEHHRRGLMAREFVDLHNEVRSRLHLPPVVWDRNLARYARQWAAKVSSTGCEMRHSMGPYGENIFWGGGSGWTPSDAVKLWVAEAAFYNLVTNTCQPNQMCGHYTQVVWQSTVRLGCERMQCNNGNIFITCNYDPPGNYIGERPFNP